MDTARAPLLRALAGHAVDPPPVWLMRQAGRYLPEYRTVRARAGSFLDLCYAPALAAEVTLQPVRRFSLDAAILFSDILVVPHGLGQAVWFEEGEGPRLEPVTDEAALARLSEPAALVDRLAPVYEAAARVAAALPPEVPLIGFAGAPWTVAAYMVEGRGSRDFLAAKRLAFTQPALFDRLLARVAAASVVHLSAQISAGARVVQLFESWAGVVPAEAFRRLVIQPTAAIVVALGALHPEVPIIGFPRQAGLLLAEYVRDSGVGALGLDPSVPLADLRALAGRLPVQGNLDPVLLVAGGAALDDAADRLRHGLAGCPWVANLGHGVPKETPPDHVARLVDRLRRPSA